ncbi:MAG TPA: divalent-cation tolerance protein CutA [Candidatus Brocadiaceae bacterium]|nr:divalent-cation tolerance protein CutA [Candidatus Brocadiaceae bacterium]
MDSGKNNPSPDHKAVIVFITTGSTDEAKKIGKLLVEEGLAACCTIIQPVESIFKWKDAIHVEQETLIISKTREELFSALEKRVKQLHGYEVPEIIAIPITQGSKSYLDWIVKETRIPGKTPS